MKVYILCEGVPHEGYTVLAASLSLEVITRKAEHIMKEEEARVKSPTSDVEYVKWEENDEVASSKFKQWNFLVKYPEFKHPTCCTYLKVITKELDE